MPLISGGSGGSSGLPSWIVADTPNLSLLVNGQIVVDSQDNSAPAIIAKAATGGGAAFQTLIEGTDETNAVTFFTDAGGELFVDARQAGAVSSIGTPLATMPLAPATQVFVSGAGAQLSTGRDVRAFTPVTFNPGAATTATCTIAVSPDNITYTTLGIETEPAGVALDGTIHVIEAFVPAAWYLRLTVNAQAVLGTTTFY